MYHRILLALSLILLAIYFESSPLKAIVNGADANNPGFQAVVNVAGCTGTFIHPNFILTAAHCFRQCTIPSDIGCVTGTGRDVYEGRAVGIDGPSNLTIYDGETPGTGNSYQTDFVYFPRASDIGRSRPPDVAILRTKTLFSGQLIPVLPHQDRPRPDESIYCQRWEYTWPYVLGFSDNPDTDGKPTTDRRRRIGRAFAECDLEKAETIFKLDGHGRDGQVGIRTCPGDSGGPVLWETGFGSFAIGGVTSGGDLGCPSDRGESFEAFIPSAFLDRVAQIDSLCRGASSWEACPGVPTPYSAYRLHYLGTVISQCGEQKISIPSPNGIVYIGKGGTAGAMLFGNPFRWYCETSEEWITAPTGTQFVVAKRAITDRQLIWDTYELLPCNPAPDEVALYRDAGFGQRCVIRKVGDFFNPAEVGLGNDTVSSIKVGGNMKVTVCQDDSYGGVCETLIGEDADLTDNLIGNDQISSVRVHCDPAPTEAALYIHNFFGSCLYKPVGDYLNPAAIGLPNDSISSLKVGNGIKATLCRDDDFGGDCETFTGDDVELSDNLIGNDQVSSMRIHCDPAPTEVAVYVHNFFGPCVYRTVGVYPNPASISLPNDSISSLKVGNAVKATLCRDDDFGSNCETFTSDDIELSDNLIGNDQVSSMRIHCDPMSTEVAVYVDNFSGQCVYRSVGDYLNPAAIGLPNDSISSLKVGNGVKATLCRDDDFGSDCETFSADDADLVDNLIGNDQVSSIRIHCDDPGPEQVALYVDNFVGKCILLDAGTYANPAAIGLPNDSISSVKPGSKVQVTLCEHDNLAGTCKIFTSEDSDLSDNGINDQVSSLEIKAVTALGSPTEPLLRQRVFMPFVAQ